MLISCSVPAINYSTCYHGEANVLMRGNGWRYGLVKADHYRQIKEINFKQPLLTIPLVSVSFLSVGGEKIN